MRNILKVSSDIESLVDNVLNMQENTIEEKMKKSNSINKLVNEILNLLKIDTSESTRMLELSEKLIKKQSELFESLSHQLFDTQKVLSNANVTKKEL